jgi:hypothetical protein
MTIKTKVARKIISGVQKIINKKKSIKAYRKAIGYKSVHPEKPYVHGAKTTAKFNFKQKPTTRSGIEIKTQRGTHYGIRGITHKMHPKGAGAVIRRMPYVGSRETWREEMSRMYGGIHMSQDPASIKKSMKILLKKKKRKIKKAKRGKFFKKLGRVALAGAALYGASRLGAPKTLSGATVKTIPVTAKNIGFPEIENKWSYLYESPTTLNEGGEVIIGNNVDRSLL